MGSMSAPDAAPLPRLGEVFFDVRGSSRSMRLSWYADTGISVFSIWQGGTCTGTFRLALEELPRLIDALQRGIRGVQRDRQHGTGGFPRQLSGAPTDPRLTALPGYGGARDADFTGPVTGDFRAARPEDQPAGGATSPRALPPGGHYASTQHGDYGGPAQYQGQGEYPQAAPADRAYPDQDYQGQDTQAIQAYQDYGDHGHQASAYPGPAYPAHAYGDQPYPDPQPQRGHGYEGLPQDYDERGYAGHGYSGRDYDGYGYPDPGYGGYGGYPDSGSYPEPAGYGPDGPGYQQPGYDGGGYQGREYPGQGYAGYGYAEQGYPGTDDPGQGYGGYSRDGGPDRQDGYASSGYAQPGYDGAAGYQPDGYRDAEYPDAPGSRAVSSFPYDGAPSSRREHRRRRRR